MGILDNFAERVAKQIVKASPSVAAITDAQIANALNRNGGNNTSYGNSQGLPRDPAAIGVPFGPGNPIIPGLINPARPDGQADPRRYEYQVAQNINISETRLVPFKTLRAAADQIDILRRCIEVLKQKMVALDWDVVLADDAIEKVMAETGEKSNIRAMQIAKEKYNDEINRLRQFWEMPDPSNGLIFADWLNMALEDILVLDAWAVWAQPTKGGDLLGLQIVDGSTIKPLIDDRGMRPAPPHPAYQQILYGFPRSEFSAPEETENADGEFLASELAYMVKNRRTNTVYGYSPVERALPIADIYLRRQQWLRAEYTDGVLPELMFETDATFGNSPDLLRAYENILNDDLAGQTEQRKRAKILPSGLKPIQFDGYGEKFKDVLDEYLITAICGHFGVQPSEIGQNPKSGLGGAGFQDGVAESSEVIGVLPLAMWVGRMISNLSYVFAGMPRELEFKFMPSKRNDEKGLAQEQDIKRKNGGLTLNEQRSRDGLPLIDLPEADQPMIVTSAGAFFLTDEGLKPIGGDAQAAPDGSVPQDNPDEKPVPESEQDAAVEESADDLETNKFVAAMLEKHNPYHDKRGRFASHESINALATSVYEKAAAAEPKITAKLQAMAGEQGAEMKGLEFRLKEEKSLKRKIMADAINEYQGNVDLAAAKIGDAVRYTMVVRPSNYTATAKKVISGLESEGYNVRAKNYWQEGSNYKGLNLSLTDPSGQAVELQMHTAKSFAIKMVDAHPIYEEFRVTPRNSARADELNQQMVDLYADLPHPKGIEAVGTPKIGKMVDLITESGMYE